MKTNTMNSSNSNYFWKMISTNMCIQIKVQRKYSVKENMYILPPQNIKYLVQCPVSLFWCRFIHWKPQHRASYLMCCFLHSFQQDRALDLDGFAQSS